jgi:hypothetical protein
MKYTHTIKTCGSSNVEQQTLTLTLKQTKFIEESPSSVKSSSIVHSQSSPFLVGALGSYVSQAYQDSASGGKLDLFTVQYFTVCTVLRVSKKFPVDQVH